MQIKHRYTNAVLFEDASGITIRQALENATVAKANLREADLYGANLYGADLRGADLREADLGEDFGKIEGERPFFQCGPIGSRSDYLQAFRTGKGTILKAGCFTGTVGDFEKALLTTHCDNKHSKEYIAALAMINAHMELWAQPEKE